jgi:hypothetical protein
MDRIPWVVRRVGPDGHPRCTATEDSHGPRRATSRGQVLTTRPDKQSNQAAVEDVECCGAGCEPWFRGARCEDGAYDGLDLHLFRGAGDLQSHPGVRWRR